MKNNDATVLILSNSSAGLYDFRGEFVRALTEKYRVVLSLPDDTKTEELKELGCEIVKTPIDRRGVNPLTDYRLMKQYEKLIEETKPGVVFTYTIKPNVYGGMACKKKGVPYVSTVTGLGSAFERGGALKKIASALYKRGLRAASCVMFQNASHESLFRKEGIYTGNGKVVSGSGVNLQRFPLQPYPEDEITRFLFVGRVMKEKGIEEYLEAAKRFHGPTVHFYTAGYNDEDYEETLRALEEKGVVYRLGFQKEMRAFYAAMDAVILPSYHEGISNVLLEAAATGRPVLASRIPGCEETFEDGVTGFGFEKKNADSLKEAVERFLKTEKKEREKMGLAGRRKVEREFDRQRVTDSYMEEAERILRS